MQVNSYIITWNSHLMRDLGDFAISNMMWVGPQSKIVPEEVVIVDDPCSPVTGHLVEWQWMCTFRFLSGWGVKHKSLHPVELDVGLSPRPWEGSAAYTEPGAWIKLGPLLQCHRTSTKGRQRARPGWDGTWELVLRSPLSLISPRLTTPTIKTAVSAWFSEDGAVSQNEIVLQAKPKCFTSSFQWHIQGRSVFTCLTHSII